jgi:hypothetical protein
MAQKGGKWFVRNDRWITAEYLRFILSYDPNTGEFRWKQKINCTIVVGELAGSSSPTGIMIGINGARVMAHRLAWLYVHGEWPVATIDHKDRNNHNNRWENLREATHFQQRGNMNLRPHKMSRFRGVSFNKQPGLARPWRAQLRVDGYSRQLGYYATQEEAHVVYEKAAKETWGDYYTPHSVLFPTSAPPPAPDPNPRT